MRLQGTKNRVRATMLTASSWMVPMRPRSLCKRDVPEGADGAGLGRLRPWASRASQRASRLESWSATAWEGSVGGPGALVAHRGSGQNLVISVWGP